MDLSFGLINFIIRSVIRPFTRLDHALQDWYRARGTESWPLAHGQIDSCHPAMLAGRIWRVTVVYTFPAEAHSWSGETWRQFAVKKDAERYAEKHPPGTVVMVRYQAGQPDKSVVLARDQHLAAPDGII